MHLQVISNQILILALLALVGLIAAKTKIIKGSEQESLAKIIFNITTPILIVLKTGQIEMSREILVNSGFILFFAFFAIFMFFFLGKLSAKLFRLQSVSTVHSLHSAFGNTVFLGFPIIDAVFPESNALLYATIYVLASNSLIWTLGVYEFTKSKSRESVNVLKFLLNPNTIAFAIGIGVMILPFKIPEFINTTFSSVGNATFPLSMLYIGSILANIRFKELFEYWHVFLVSFNKLLLFPFLFMLIIYFVLEISQLNIEFIPRMVLVLQTAMPCQVIVVILAGNYKKNPEIATQQMVIATLFSIITIPLIYSIGMYFLG